MLAKFDNLDDVNSKFCGTICLYNGQPINILSVGYNDDNPKAFVLYAKFHDKHDPVPVDLEDPAFSYRDFNLGYCNWKNSAVWWYRKPTRQYQQGLRKNQLGFRAQHLDHDLQFGFNANCISMLRNQYPTLETAKKKVQVGGIIDVAFHRDFAVSYYAPTNQFYLFFRGKCCAKTNRLGDFVLNKEYEYLKETLQEVLAAEKLKKINNAQFEK